MIWKKPDIDNENVNEHCARIHGVYAASWSRTNKCCPEEISEKTFQEILQQISGHSKHMGPGQTVGLVCVAFAVIMGCNPIYVSGLDLDYSLGYAGEIKNYGVNDDMEILKESAELLGSKIINLNHDSWYDSFEKGEL